MKLSEAIRLGAMLNPQAFRSFATFRRDKPLVVEKTCALGAAKEAGYLGRLHMDLRMERQSCVIADCQYGQRRRLLLASWIVHLNDKHRWTREQIADWVETIERAQESPDPTCESTARTEQETASTAVSFAKK